MFFNGNNSKARKRKKLQKKLRQRYRQEFNRRTHIILEARKKHEKNRLKAKETLSMGGYTETPSIEDENFGFAVAANITKSIQMSGNAIEKLKKRGRKLQKSKQTHLQRMKKAKGKMKSRSRT